MKFLTSDISKVKSKNVLQDSDHATAPNKFCLVTLKFGIILFYKGQISIVTRQQSWRFKR